MLKKTIVLTLFFSLFFMLLTSLVMYIVPPARVASWADWAFLGISRAHWEGAHLGMGLLFCAAGLAHLLLNWDSLLDYLRDADGVVVVFTRPFFFGLILSLFVFVGALAGLPPVKQLVALSNYIKDRAVEVYGEPPYSMPSAPPWPTSPGAWAWSRTRPWPCCACATSRPNRPT